MFANRPDTQGTFALWIVLQYRYEIWIVPNANPDGRDRVVEQRQVA